MHTLLKSSSLWIRGARLSSLALACWTFSGAFSLMAQENNPVQPAPVALEQSITTDALFKELELYLSPENMRKLIPDESADALFVLAQEEDMDISGSYLLSDDFLRQLNKKSVLSSVFGQIVEELQNRASASDEEGRLGIQSRWRSFWLEKMTEYIRYYKSLKRRWTISLSNTVDYDSNVQLKVDNDPNNPNEKSSDRDDTGETLMGSFTWRPLVNHRSYSPLKLETNFNLIDRRQSAEKEVQFISPGIDQQVKISHPDFFFTDTTLTAGFKNSFNTDPNKKRKSFDEYSISSYSNSRSLTHSSFFFPSSSFNIGLSYRYKIQKKDDAFSQPSDFQSDTVTLRGGQNFVRNLRGEPMQTFGWNLSLETQGTDVDTTRDYIHASVGANYSRQLPKLVFDRDFLWASSISLRLKDWDNPAPVSSTEEGQLMLSTSLRYSWTRSISSRLALSYLHKEQNVHYGSDSSVNQWKVALSNNFLTF